MDRFRRRSNPRVTSPESSQISKNTSFVDLCDLNGYTYINCTPDDLKQRHNTYCNEKEKALLSKRKDKLETKKGRTVESIRTNPKRNVMDSFSFGSTASKLSIVTDNILLGGVHDASDDKTLKNLGVTYILNMAQQIPNQFPHDFVYLKIPLLDTKETDVTECMSTVCAFLSHVEAVDGRVLVHCIAGVSRSVVVLIMYMVMVHRIPLQDVFNYVKSCRYIIAPNEGFRLQLILCELKTLGYSSVALNRDKTWDFYEFSRIRHSVPTTPPPLPSASSSSGYSGSSGISRNVSTGYW